ASDYTQWYRQNVGIDPPRLEPFGAYGDPSLTRVQTDQYPYLPLMTYSGGDRTNLASFDVNRGNGPLPRRNQNYRYTFQDDLSKTMARHSLKFGFSTERDSKTEPGSSNYAGTYAFGDDSSNPLSSHNGYANALLGVFTTYSELTARVDQENRHWQSDAYAQDS